MSAISNNTVNGEGMFISGKMLLEHCRSFKKSFRFPWREIGDLSMNYQCGVPIQINTVPLLRGTTFLKISCKKKRVV